MKYELRDYQNDGVITLRNAYAKGYKSPLYCLSTGGGKTIVFCNIAENAAKRGKRVMILVHRKELLEQAIEKLDENGISCGVIAAGRTMTCDLIQVASVDTLIRRLDKVPKPDLIIVDEAHHCVPGNKWGNVVKYFKCFVLGVTATPIRSSGIGLGVVAGGYFDTLIVGPTIQELIKRGFLSQPEVYAPPVVAELKGMRSRMGDFASDEISNRMDRSVITGDAIKHYQKICPGVPAIVFTASVKHAEHVAQQFNDAGIPSASLDGTMAPGQRKWRISALGNGKIKVLTSCDIISEGTDIPVIGAAILLRPTKSLGLFLQQCGRVLRPYPGKKKAIILDHVGNTLRFGMVDEIRDWSLDGEREELKKRKERREIDKIVICSKCYAANFRGREKCFLCGASLPKKDREVEQVAGELEKISAEQLAVIRKKKYARMEQGKADSLQALQELAKKRGFKPGWAKHVWKARQQKL